MPLGASEPVGLAPADEPRAAIFTAAIARLADLYPHSPEELRTRLSFADFLARATGGNCLLRLDGAQRQLEQVLASPDVDATVPAGLARTASIEYEIHVARAACNEAAAMHEQELREALTAAQHAVELYRDAYDAVAMTTMQFNTAVTYHSLGNEPAAVAALQRTIDLDREYGFRDDATENYQLLEQWTHGPTDPDTIAKRMAGFPERSVTLTFGWVAGDANVSLDSAYTRIIGDAVAHSRATRTARRQVRARFGGLAVTYEPAPGDYDAGAAPVGDAPFLQDLYILGLTRLLLHFHDFQLTRGGDFVVNTHSDRFRQRVRSESAALTAKLTADSDPAPQLKQRIDKAVNIAAESDSIDPFFATEYNLETGMWMGASLDQGVWYEMTATLPLPIAPQFFVSHKMEFAYTRSVPCTADSTAPACIEIVLRAAPESTELTQLARTVAPPGQLQWCSSATQMRLVLDPTTLQPYSREMRQYSFWSTGPGRSLIESEKTVFASDRVKPPEPAPSQ